MNQAKTTVAVIGTGTMGQGIAQVFVQAGYPVKMFDSQEGAAERAVKQIDKFLSKSVEKGKLSAEARAQAVTHLRPVSQIEQVQDAGLAVEAVFEQMDVKKDVLTRLDAVLPAEAILATNTSSISVTALAAGTRRPARFIGMHFFNPVPLMKLVEVVVGLETDEATVSTTCKLAEAVGKTPLIVKDHPGFVANRVLLPMINEAVGCLAEGVADAKTIDGVMKLGCNHPMGPLELADLIGLDVCLHILEVLHRDLGEDRYRPNPLLRKMVLAGRLGRKTAKGFFEYG